MNPYLRIAYGVAASAVFFIGAAAAQTAVQSDTITAAIRDGALTFEFRPRYETAQQDGFADASALTARTRLGWRTAQWRGIQGAIEIESVADLAGDHNDGVPPVEPYATIADPDGVELNLAHIAWAPREGLKTTLGRQRILLDDQRFIGASAWRQDDQTFDALFVEARHGPFQASYGYLDHINRIFADDLDWSSDSHIFNASYTLNPAFEATGFAYLLDFEGAGAAASNATYGVRITGATTLNGAQLTYAASYAVQSDHGDNPTDYDVAYAALEMGVSHGPVMGKLGFESLEGDGPGQRFQTPLATLHAFQGWADVFLTTPNDGLVDLYASVAYRPEVPFIRNAALTLTWHDFEAERTGADLGEEIDLQFTGGLTDRLSLTVKYADYDGVGAPPDTTRAWFGVEYKI